MVLFIFERPASARDRLQSQMISARHRAPLVANLVGRPSQLWLAHKLARRLMLAYPLLYYSPPLARARLSVPCPRSCTSAEHSAHVDAEDDPFTVAQDGSKVSGQQRPAIVRSDKRRHRLAVPTVGSLHERDVREVRIYGRRG